MTGLIFIGVGAGFFGAVAGIGAFFGFIARRNKKKKVTKKGAEYVTREKIATITNALNKVLEHLGMSKSQVANDLNRFDIDPEVRERLIKDIKFAETYNQTEVSKKELDKAQKTIKL